MKTKWPALVGYDLKTGDRFLAPRYGTVYIVMDSFPHSVRVQDMEGFEFPLTYEEIHDRNCVHINPQQERSARLKIVNLMRKAKQDELLSEQKAAVFEAELQVLRKESDPIAQAVREMMICTRFQISKAQVRECLQHLEAKSA